MQSSSSEERNTENIKDMDSDIKTKSMQVGSPDEVKSEMVENSTEQNKKYNKHLDITCKLLVAKNVVKACRKKKNLSRGNGYYFKHVNKYTSIWTKTLKDLKKEIKIPKTFLHCEFPDNSLYTFSQYNYDIREILVKYYVTKGIVPSKSVLIKELTEKGYKKKEKLGILLDIAGFTWQHLPKINKSIIIEKPEQAFKRHIYLKKIKEYRDNKRDLIYVGKSSRVPHEIGLKKCNTRKQCTDSCIFIAASATGVVNKSFYPNDTFFMKWITNVLLCVLPSSSVLVINEKDCKEDDIFLPTSSSKKSEMIEWLKIHNIPHDPNVHRAELFKILQIYMVSLERNAIVKQLFEHGHEVIRRPDNVTPYDFFEKLWMVQLKYTRLSTRYHLLDVISHCSSEDWMACEREISETESRLYAEDMEIEEIIDSLMAMEKNGDTSAFQELGPDFSCVKETPSLSDIILN